MDSVYLTQAEEKMTKAISNLETNLSKVRTGRANPKILDGVEANYYGSPTPINQIASISISEGKTLVIKPYDANSLKDIERAINESNIGLPPLSDGSVIRITTPQLTEETRKGFCKDVDKMSEETKVVIRNARRDANDAVKKDKNLPEDTSKNLQEEIQKLTDKYIEKVENLAKDKQKEIMTI